MLGMRPFDLSIGWTSFSCRNQSFDSTEKKKEKKEREYKSKSWKNPRSKKTKTCNHLAGHILKTYWAKLTFEQVFENVS